MRHFRIVALLFALQRNGVFHSTITLELQNQLQNSGVPPWSKQRAYVVDGSAPRSAFGMSEQRRHGGDWNQSDINDAVVDAKRQRNRRLAVELGRFAGFLDGLDQAGIGTLAHDPA